jgi:hypothetical protein
MKFVLITNDQTLANAAREGFPPSDQLLIFEKWQEALDACEGARLLLVDLIATLETPHKIAGYEAFGTAKMSHPVASATPLVLISPDDSYDIDFLVGWEGFVFANIRRPVQVETFRHVSTWI